MNQKLYDKIGYNQLKEPLLKDGKHQHPQIFLGLLVGRNGYPIGYDIFTKSTKKMVQD